MGGGATTEISANTAQMASFDGWDYADKAFEGVDFAGGFLAAITDPIAWLASSAASFLMSHVHPLTDALDKVVGNPDGVELKARRWDAAASMLREASAGFAAIADREMSQWTGPSGEQTREFLKGLQANLEETAARCRDASTGMRVASSLVEVVRSLVTGVISDVVGQFISWAVQMLITVGVGASWVVPKAIAKVASVLKKIQKWYQKAVKKIAKIAQKIKKLNEIFEKSRIHSSKVGSALLALIKQGGKLSPAVVRAAKAGPSLRWLLEAATPTFTGLLKTGFDATARIVPGGVT